MAGARTPLIAVLDQDAVLLRLMCALFKSEGYNTLLLRNSASAYDVVKERKPDMLMLDTWVEDRESGWTLLQQLLSDGETRQIPILLCSSDPDSVEGHRARVRRHSRIEVLPKPYDTHILLHKVRSLLAPAAALPR